MQCCTKIYYYNKESKSIELVEQYFNVKVERSSLDPEIIYRKLRSRIGDKIKVGDMSHDILDIFAHDDFGRQLLAKHQEHTFYHVRAIALDNLKTFEIHTSFYSSLDLENAKINAYYFFREGIYYHNKLYDLISLQLLRPQYDLISPRELTSRYDAILRPQYNIVVDVDLEEEPRILQKPLELESCIEEIKIPMNEEARKLVDFSSLRCSEIEELPEIPRIRPMISRFCKNKVYKPLE